MKSTTATIVKRRVHIDFDSAPATRWYPREPVTETFLNAVSFFLPAGEKFFIESVQHYKHRIADPVLQDQVQRFIYQEAMHTREHINCNRMLSKTFRYGPRIEKIGEFFLNLARWFTPKASQLAVTCAIEHYTAILADNLLRNQAGVIQNADPEFAKFWIWHAVEETEHKAVCLDVYQEVVGRGPIAYLLRVVAMLLTTLFLMIAVAIAVVLIKRGQPTVRVATKKSTEHPVTMLKFVKALVPWQLYFDYFRPSFHPWDHQNAHLIEAWKVTFPDFGVSSNHPASDV